MLGRVVTAAIGMLGLVAPAGAAAAQEEKRCRFLCAPELKIEPTFTLAPLGKRTEILSVSDGTVSRERRETTFEIVLAVDIPTSVNRLGFSVESIWSPFKGTSSNPFTGKTAEDVGVMQIRDNPVELEFEVHWEVLRSEQTGGWVHSHVDVVDQFSPSERPTSRGIYTHKLDFEWDTSFAPFSRLRPERWLRGVELEGSLDYLATGLPKTGDQLGTERFLDNADKWSFSFVVVIPVAPLE
jgi:hypothetical protein